MAAFQSTKEAYEDTGFTLVLKGIIQIENKTGQNTASTTPCCGRLAKEAGESATSTSSRGSKSGTSFPMEAFLRRVLLNFLVITGGLLPDVGWNSIVHEIGPWFGLLHPFHGGCHPDPHLGGDLVYDTPASDYPVHSCDGPKPRRSLGVEIDYNNHMDYARPDTCRTHFTPGQVKHMRFLYFQQRYLPGASMNPNANHFPW
ncbi:hypothetical protein JOL62DRAFT_642337 [Phyllosticta paracitricarpa]|uniref:Peptidase M43 pregnancy-associated plasma-A domain-containing protein n=2 Tax=Phyllosticta TaxID=121621 RepID=A0ABR1LS44_9PEZI